MNKNLVIAINHIYPDLVPFKDFRVIEENGVQEVADWHASVPQPTDAELDDAWQTVSLTIKDKELEEARNLKQKELNDLCGADLTYGYQYIVNEVQYRFSFDLEAQTNFQGALRLLESGKVPFVPWTAYDPSGKRVRLNLTLDDLYGMELSQFHHKNDVTSKYNDLLLNHLYVAQSIDDIQAVSWGEMI